MGKSVVISGVVLLLICLCAQAQQPSGSEAGQPTGQFRRPKALFSPSVARIFYEIAYEIGNYEPQQIQDEPEKIKQAMTFLRATMTLDESARYTFPEMIKLAGLSQFCPPEESADVAWGEYSRLVYNVLTEYIDKSADLEILKGEYSRLVYNVLTEYIDESADLEILKNAVQFLLEQYNSREERETLLAYLLRTLRDKNPALDSELATLLGLLMVEKADTQAAQGYFMQAYTSNRYNKLAFMKLDELATEPLQPVTYLAELRLQLAEDPFGLENALGFAKYAAKLHLYELALKSYEYCADLFGFLYPGQPLAAEIYIPWALSSYNTERGQHKCLQIAEAVRRSGRFDLLLEVLAAKAATRTGRPQEGSAILRAAAAKAVDLFHKSSGRHVTAEQIAWFYCFGLPEAKKAVDWANRAYAADPNSSTAAAVLAYSFVLEGQMDWAKPLIEGYQNNAISGLALARMQLAQEQKDLAVETLKSVIASDPMAIEADVAKEILAQNDAEYVPAIDSDFVLTVIKRNFGEDIVPEFRKPTEVVSVRFNVRGEKFTYGREFDGSVAITNNWSEPLIISDDGLFRGNIRVDAEIRGDLEKTIPNLLSFRSRPASVIEPERNLLIPLKLVTGELKLILQTHPQASLEIEFTLYIDPVVGNDGKLSNRIRSLAPAKIVVERPGVKLTHKYMQNRLNSLAKGQQGQRIDITRLFIGLLAEQRVMADGEPPYKFMYAEWMPAMLKSALLRSLDDEDWIVKVNTMGGLLSLPLDYKLIRATAVNLDDSEWPVRLMAIYLLAKSQNGEFKKVLDHTAEYDSNKLVRDMAIALGAAKPEKPQPTGPEDVNTTNEKISDGNKQGR